MTVYIDVIFLENLFMNYIIIYATTIILKEKIRIIRGLISSALGSLYAVLIYINISSIITKNIILKIILSIVMIYIAYKPNNLKILCKQLLLFYLTSFTFGGVAFALLYFINPKKILFDNGVLIGTYPIKIILGGGILGFIIITYAFKTIKGKLSKKDMICETKITLKKKSIFIKTMIDTGNLLRDPITKIPVMIVEKEELKKLIPTSILDNLDGIIKGEKKEIDYEYISKIKVIPFKSIGMQNGILIGIKADNVIIKNEEINQVVNNVIIGIYEGKLNKNHKYSGLIGLDMLEDKGGILENEYIGNSKI